jgi:hypothetical protein
VKKKKKNPRVKVEGLTMRVPVADAMQLLGVAEQ